MKITLRHAVRVAVCLVAMHTFGQTTDPSAQLKDTLVNLEKDSWRAWKARDGEFYKTFLSDDHVEVGPGGTDGKDAIVDFVGSPRCVVASWEADQFTLTMVNPETALLVYHAKQDTKCGGVQVPSPAWVSSLYAKRNGRWLNVLYQQTPSRK